MYVHAHMVMGVPMRQAVLQSGSLYLSPPIPEKRAKDIVAKVENWLGLNGSSGLREAPAEEILKAQADLGMVSLFLQMEPDLQGWRDKLGHAERLLIGDCEYEVSGSAQCFIQTTNAQNSVCHLAQRRRNLVSPVYMP